MCKINKSDGERLLNMPIEILKSQGKRMVKIKDIERYARNINAYGWIELSSISLINMRQFNDLALETCLGIKQKRKETKETISFIQNVNDWKQSLLDTLEE